MSTTVVNLKHADYDVFIGRPSEWGCPFVIGKDGTREEVLEKYRRYMERRPDLKARAKLELRGLVLGCYCKPLPCHGDILAAIADED